MGESGKTEGYDPRLSRCQTVTYPPICNTRGGHRLGYSCIVCSKIQHAETILRLQARITWMLYAFFEAFDLVFINPISSSDWPQLLGSSSWPPNHNRVCRSHNSSHRSLRGPGGLCSGCSSCHPCALGHRSLGLNHPSCHSSPGSSTGSSAACLCSCSPCTHSCPCTSAGGPPGRAADVDHQLGRLLRAASWSGAWWAAGDLAHRSAGDRQSTTSGSATGTSAGSAAVHAGDQTFHFSILLNIIL